MWVGCYDAVVFVAFASGARSTVPWDVSEDVVDVVSDLFSVVGADECSSGRWRLWPMVVLLEKSRELRLYLLFERECMWAF